MSLGHTHRMLSAADNVERNLHAARTGERLTFRPESPFEGACINCGMGVTAHITESGVMFCADWALRERWGK